MLTKVRLHGDLAEFVGHKELEAVINSTADAIKFLLCNFPKLEAYMSDKYYKVLVNKEELTTDQIHDPIGKAQINIVPVIVGAGGNAGKIILGVALIGIAIASGGGFAAISAKEFSLGFWGTLAMNVGAALTLTGVSGLLFPLPDPKDFEDDQDPRISFGFNGIQNTSRAGTSIPIVYGETVTGSVVISAGIDTNQVHT